MALLAIIDILHYLISVLIWLMIAQFVLSLLVSFNVINTHNQFVGGLWQALDTLLEPLYRPIRKIVPAVGGMDFSPMFAIILLNVLSKILTYSAFDDTKRGTPLMMGRVRVIAPRRKAAVAASRWEIAGLALGGLLLIPVGFWFVAQGRRHKPLAVVPPSALDPQWVPFQDAAPVPLTDFDPTRVGSPVEEAHANHT